MPNMMECFEQGYAGLITSISPRKHHVSVKISSVSFGDVSSEVKVDQELTLRQRSRRLAFFICPNQKFWAHLFRLGLIYLSIYLFLAVGDYLAWNGPKVSECHSIVAAWITADILSFRTRIKGETYVIYIPNKFVKGISGKRHDSTQNMQSYGATNIRYSCTVMISSQRYTSNFNFQNSDGLHT